MFGKDKSLNVRIIIWEFKFDRENEEGKKCKVQARKTHIISIQVIRSRCIRRSIDWFDMMHQRDIQSEQIKTIVIQHTTQRAH